MRNIELDNTIETSTGGTQYILPTWQDELSKDLTDKKREFLNFYFTNVDGDVHAIRGTMPPVLAAALITRFSRAQETDITEIFWNEFVNDTELGIKNIAESLVESGGLEQALAEEQASALIRRVVDKFGDDSVREQASGYVIFQDTSVLFSLQAFRHPLVTGIEASTRYIDWGEKDENGEYRYVVPDALKGTKHEDVYKEAMDGLFETYKELWEPVEAHIVKTNPRPDNVSEGAYKIAVKGRVLDNLRKLLPLGIKTNFGVHATYRSLSELAMNLKASGLEEARSSADKMTEELMKVNPEFMAVVDSQHGASWVEHRRKTREALTEFSLPREVEEDITPSVEVEVLNKDYLRDLVVGAISYVNPSLEEKETNALATEIIADGSYKELLVKIGRARGNRRHKLPDFLQRVVIRMKFRGISFGSAKDFNRHRYNLDKIEIDWSCRSGIYIPKDIEVIGGAVKEKYLGAQRKALKIIRKIAKDFPEEARMLFSHGMKTVLEIVAGLGQAYWVPELRSIASGDPEYRWFAQEDNRKLEEAMPEVKLVGNFVDTNDYTVGRIGEAVRADLKGTSAAE